MTHRFLSAGRSDVLAHRGASQTHPPGNTWTSFSAAVAAGVDHIETDVQATSEGVVVVFHDERLDDLTTGSGTIADHRWEELADLVYLHEGEPIGEGLVRLDRLMTELPDTFFNIDIKTDDAVAPTVSILRRANAADRVCVAAFGWRRLRRLRRTLGPGWCSAFSQPEIIVARLASWLRLPVPRFGDVVQIPRRHRSIPVADERMIEACRARGVAVHVWTVNDPTEATHLRSLGVDAIITDRPEAIADEIRTSR